MCVYILENVSSWRRKREGERRKEEQKKRHHPVPSHFSRKRGRRMDGWMVEEQKRLVSKTLGLGSSYIKAPRFFIFFIFMSHTNFWSFQRPQAFLISSQILLLPRFYAHSSPFHSRLHNVQFHASGYVFAVSVLDPKPNRFFPIILQQSFSKANRSTATLDPSYRAIGFVGSWVHKITYTGLPLILTNRQIQPSSSTRPVIIPSITQSKPCKEHRGRGGQYMSFAHLTQVARAMRIALQMVLRGRYQSGGVNHTFFSHSEPH